MRCETTMAEFRSAWLPHIPDAALNRLVELLESGSPLLIHGAFTKAIPMGCLASHIAWNHPTCSHLDEEAGVHWLTRVARLNPATSKLIVAWDSLEPTDLELRPALLHACREECERRANNSSPVSHESGCVPCEAY